MIDTNSQLQTRTALVLGATGGLGGAVAHALIAHGWTIRALTRDPAAAARKTDFDTRLTWVRGDCLDAAAVRVAAQDTRLIVHAVNPPGYRNWREVAIPMLANSIAAAKASGARILFPGNVYNFDPAAGPLLSEDTPQIPVTLKGKVRVEMEAMLRTAAAQDGVRSLVLRAGDFFGPGSDNNWFAQVVAKGGRRATRVVDPGQPGVGHAWAYLPNMAEAFAQLADRDAELAAAEVFHFGGHWINPGRGMAEAAREALGPPLRPIKSFPWIFVWLGAPFVRFLREMIEMRYLWRVPLELDNRKLVACLGREPHTPLKDALIETFAAT